MKQFRQGDVWIEEVCSIPENAEKQKSKKIILAEGEATGHAHKILTGATAFKIDGQLYLDCEGNVTVEHEEHAPIVLPKGKYVVRIQREYSPEAIRNVKD